MTIRHYAWGTAIFLILGLIGLIVFWLNSLNTPGILTLLQVSTTIYMILLSIAIFFMNNETKLATKYGILPVKGYVYLSFIFIIGGVIVVELISLYSNNGWFLPPLFLALITLGIYCAGKGLYYV